MSVVDLEITGTVPPNITIKVAGHEVVGVRSLNLDLTATEIPMVYLDVEAASLITRIQADVRINKPAHDFLIALGWTPPVSDVKS